MDSTQEPTYREKNRRLYFEQKKTLDLFLERGAIELRRFNTKNGF